MAGANSCTFNFFGLPPEIRFRVLSLAHPLSDKCITTHNHSLQRPTPIIRRAQSHPHAPPVSSQYHAEVVAATQSRGYVFCFPFCKVHFKDVCLKYGSKEKVQMIMPAVASLRINWSAVMDCAASKRKNDLRQYLMGSHSDCIICRLGNVGAQGKSFLSA